MAGLDITYTPDALYPEYATIKLTGEHMTNGKRRIDDIRAGGELDWSEPKFNVLDIAETWAITVEAEGQRVLCISHEHVAGLDGERLEQFAPTIRSCAMHLLGFIGSAPIPPLTAPAPLTGWKIIAMPLPDEGDANAIVKMGWAYLDAARAAEPGKTWLFSHAGYRAMLSFAERNATAPAPQQIKLSRKRIWEIGREIHLDGMSEKDFTFAKAIEREVKAAPAAPVQTAELKEMEARKDAAYLERNQVVAALAKCFPSGVARTAIEGWSEDWHGCVYIDLPTGQASWHFHDSQAYLFDGLLPYTGKWDGHTTEEKYARLASLAAPVQAEQAQAEPINEEAEFFKWWHANDHSGCGPAQLGWYARAKLAAPTQAEQAAAVRAAYEQAAHLCETIGTDWLEADDANKNFAADYLAKKIRALAAPSTATSNDTGALGGKGAEA